jgi:SAM-dependent methyltransferase
VERAEFDQFADEYHDQHRSNVAITGEEPEFFARYKIQVLRALAQEMGVVADRIIDFGSGIGNSIPHFAGCFPQARLTCADVSSRSLAISRSRFEGVSEYVEITGSRIPLDDGRFDVAFSACVFHHIPHEEHVPWLRELHRVTRPGGMLTVFEHNPLNPLTVRAVNTCPFDENARLIRAGVLAERFEAAGWPRPQVRYHVFFPRVLARLRPLEPRLARVPLGAQYAVTAVKSS